MTSKGARMTKDVDLAGILAPVAEALIDHDSVRREREHDRTHDGGGRLRLERSTGRLAPNRAGVNAAKSIITPENVISAAANLEDQLADLADAIAAASEDAIGNAWSVLTNGDPVTPELIFAGGDVVMVEVPR